MLKEDPMLLSRTQKMLKALVALIAAVIALTGSLFAQTAFMPATIYDHSKNDPDFESFTGSGVYPGLVEDQLDANGKPVYKPTGPTPVTSGPLVFAGWFKTDQSLVIDYDLPFEKVEDCQRAMEWRSENPQFFPIDNQLGGNEGFNHNYHFTAHLETEFYFEPGQAIEVAADDDLWIFINGQLVLDLGGAHPTIRGSLYLDFIAKDLELQPGDIAKLDIFYAERKYNGAVLNIEHNLDILGWP
jgi:fibro-slime domain-containing protein